MNEFHGLLLLLGIFLWGVETLINKTKEHGGSVKVELPGVFTFTSEEKTGPEAEAAQVLLKRLVLVGKILTITILVGLTIGMWLQ